VTGNDPALIERVRTLRDHGRSSKYLHAEVGFAERMDALQAAILAVKLPHLDRWTELRQSVAERYRALLATLPLELPVATPGARAAFHLYVVRTPERDALLEHLKTDGIMAGVHYPVPLHRQPAYLDLGYRSVTLPVAERAAREVLSLPLYPELDQSRAERVASSIERYFA
jgi:dTDP-4-amino-4,6-dideoxygalactose transaminase